MAKESRKMCKMGPDIYGYMSESNLASELQLCEYLQKYDDRCLSKDDLALIEKEVENIIKNEPNINTITEQYIGKIFHTKSARKQHLYFELIYYIVGKRWTEQSASVTLEKLDKWGDAVMGYGFYKGFNLTKKDTERLITDIRNNPSYIAANTRDVDRLRCKYAEYYQKAFDEGQGEDDIIKKIHPRDDGAYTELPESVDTIIHCCIRNGWFDLWLSMYEILGYAPLQGRIVYDLRTIQQLLSVMEVEKKRHVKYRKVFADLLSHRAFQLFIDQQDLLERNAENDQLNKSQRSQAALVLQLWKKQRENYLEKFVDLLLQISDIDDVLSWLNQKERNAACKRGVYKEKDVRLIKDIWRILKLHIGNPTIDVENCSLDRLLSYVYNVDIDSLSQEKCSEIIKAICRNIYTDEHMYVGWDFSDTSFEQMRAVYSCLEKSGLSGIGLAQSNIPVTEGYKTAIDKHLRLQFAHKVWLSVLMLQAEVNDDPVNEFARNEQFMYECAYKSDVDLMDYYMLPFLIGEAVVLQISKEYGCMWLKDKYEEKLIDTINDLMLVMIVLSLNKGNISDANKEKVTQRLNMEWDVAVAMNPRNPNIKICEQYFKELY